MNFNVRTDAKASSREMNATSPKSSLAKLGLFPRQKSLKVMVLGQGGVGKSAMVVRFITRRYIGEYDPSLEKMYTFHTVVDNEMVYFDILDTAGQPTESESLALEANIRWAEAFILMYSVSDKCSFDECYRLKFLINYNKRRRRLGGGTGKEQHMADVPVVLVGNKTDQVDDRMVSSEEGHRRSKEIGCVCFHEISVQESVDQVWGVFRDVCRFWRVQNKCPSKLRRSGSDNKEPMSPDTVRLLCSAAVSPGSLIPCRPTTFPSTSMTSTSAITHGNNCLTQQLSSSVGSSAPLNRRWTEVDGEEDDEVKENGSSCASSPGEANGSQPFRGRASTDGNLLQRPWRWRYPPPGAGMNQEFYSSTRADRRMSISMRGNNASY